MTRHVPDCLTPFNVYLHRSYDFARKLLTVQYLQTALYLLVVDIVRNMEIVEANKLQ